MKKTSSVVRSVLLVAGIYACLMINVRHIQAGAGEEYRFVKDMRGVEVRIPKKLNRVVTLDDGFCAGIMTVLGEADKLVAVGSQCPAKVYSYKYRSIHGKEYVYDRGMNPVRFLNPRVGELPRITGYGQASNFETLARLNPDLVFLRVGSCYADDNSGDSEVLKRKIKMINSLGIPLVILNGPPAFAKPTIDHLCEEIIVVGEAFGKKEKARDLAGYLSGLVKEVALRTAGVPEKDRPRALLFGLSARVRTKGGAGAVHGRDTIESYFLEEIVHARNAYQGLGQFVTISAEQVISMNPDVIILPTCSGYHPPVELYSAPYYQMLQGLDAIAGRRAAALPWTPCNCAKRIEYPIEVLIMAKACHPELFEDIKVHEWLLDFYRKVYGVDEQTAEGLRSAQWLDWTVQENW